VFLDEKVQNIYKYIKSSRLLKTPPSPCQSSFPTEAHDKYKVILSQSPYPVDSWGLGVVLYKVLYGRFPELDLTTSPTTVKDLDLSIPEEYRVRRGWLTSLYEGVETLIRGLLHPHLLSRVLVVSA
jgi:hypothetical protein